MRCCCWPVLLLQLASTSGCRHLSADHPSAGWQAAATSHAICLHYPAAASITGCSHSEIHGRCAADVEQYKGVVASTRGDDASTRNASGCVCCFHSTHDLLACWRRLRCHVSRAADRPRSWCARATSSVRPHPLLSRCVYTGLHSNAGKWFAGTIAKLYLDGACDVAFIDVRSAGLDTC